jgi:YidC/Oxa1 family membrane protein insertase
MQHIFYLVLYQPIFNAFIALYNLVPDLGAAIIILTIIIKLVLYPFNTAAIKAQKSMADLQPHLEEVKKQYKGDQQKIAQETMLLYQKNKVNPLGSCLPLIVQLVISITLYYVLRNGLSNTQLDFSTLYSFVRRPETIKTVSLGLFDLHKGGNVVLALLAGAAQYWQAHMMIRNRPPKPVSPGAKDEDMMAIMNKQMLYMLPLVTLVVGYQLPSGLALYWLVSTLFTVAQQIFVFRKHDNTTATIATPPAV